MYICPVFPAHTCIPLLRTYIRRILVADRFRQLFTVERAFPNISMPSLSPEEEAAEIARLKEALRTATDRVLEVELAKLRIAVKTGDAQSVSMSLSMLLALTICPAMLGSQEAIRQSQSKTRREEHRGRRCNLVVSCIKSSTRARDVDRRKIVLRDSKVSSPPSYSTVN
jgi:hypothetical protein